ncbi:TPA: Ig-like domain-containing protein, partial [Staphylococcus aureus]
MNNLFGEKERFGIRKITIGAASIVVGSFIYGVTNNNEASASELTEQVPEMNQQETNLHQEKVSKDITEVSKQSDEVTQNSEKTQAEVYNAQPLKEQKPEVVENKPAPVQAPKFQKDEKVKQESQETSINLEPRVQKAVATESDKAKEKDVSKEVIVESAKITGFNGGESIRPHMGQGGKLEYRLKFPDNLNKDDYFTIQLSDNINTHGISVERIAPNIKDNSNINEEDIAIATVGQDGKTITYTFTDYVRNKQNLIANLSLSYFTDHNKIRESEYQTVTSKIGDQKTTQQIYVYYDNSQYVDARISELDKENGKFKNIAYVNPNGYYTGQGYVTVSGQVTQGFSNNAGKPKVTIYQYTGQKLPASISSDFDASEIKEVDASNVMLNDDGTYSAVLKVQDGEKYIILYEGSYDSKSQTLLYRTYTQSYSGYHYQKVNGVKLYENSADGNGEQKPAPPKPPKPPKPEIETQNNLIEETIESNPIDINWNSGNEEISGQNNGAQNEIEENNIIDIIEDTTPEGDSGQNNGNQEEIEENNIIDIIEDTTPEGDSG